MAKEILIMARFASTCTECKRKINVSDFIWFNPFSKTSRHKKCNKEKKERMNKEELQLLATILNEVVDKHIQALRPYYVFNVNVGQCTSCNAVGCVKYPDIVYDHKDTCLFKLNERLQESLKEKEGMNE